MRKEIFRMPDVDARAMLAAANEMTFAAISRRPRGTAGDAEPAATEDDIPLLRVVNTWVSGDAIYFHGAPAGEKMEALGARAVFETSRVIARLPSYFIDPERACPATTLYESVQAHGILRRVEDREEKARALTGLLEKLQPEGGYAPLGQPMYDKAIDGLLVVRMDVTRVDGKRKVGQNRSAKERARIVEGLFARGAPGDAEAIEMIFAHNEDTPVPAILTAPRRGRFTAALPRARYPEALALLRQGAYWLERTPDALVLASMDAPSVMVGAFDSAGSLVAVARIVADARVAWIYDVIVAKEARRSGLGASLMQFVLAHPVVRRVGKVRLTTRDSEAFYRKLGFGLLSELPRHPWVSVEMIRHADHARA